MAGGLNKRGTLIPNPAFRADRHDLGTSASLTRFFVVTAVLVSQHFDDRRQQTVSSREKPSDRHQRDESNPDHCDHEGTRSQVRCQCGSRVEPVTLGDAA